MNVPPNSSDTSSPPKKRKNESDSSSNVAVKQMKLLDGKVVPLFYFKVNMDHKKEVEQKMEEMNQDQPPQVPSPLSLLSSSSSEPNESKKSVVVETKEYTNASMDSYIQRLLQENQIKTQQVKELEEQNRRLMFILSQMLKHPEES